MNLGRITPPLAPVTAGGKSFPLTSVETSARSRSRHRQSGLVLREPPACRGRDAQLIDEKARLAVSRPAAGAASSHKELFMREPWLAFGGRAGAGVGLGGKEDEKVNFLAGWSREALETAFLAGCKATKWCGKKKKIIEHFSPPPP